MIGGVCAGLANYFDMDPIHYADPVCSYCFCRRCFAAGLSDHVGNCSDGTVNDVSKAIKLRKHMSVKRLTRSKDNKMLAGVLAGIGDYFRL